MKITPRLRPLVDICIDDSFKLKPEEIQQLKDWCRNHSTFCHTECDEFQFWIPPVAESKRLLESTYGKEIPDLILNIFNEVIKVQADKEDAGYLLIAFI